MFTSICTLLTFGLLCCVQAARAQSNDYTVAPLTDRIYELSYDAGGYVVKVIASVGDDGILLVDTGHKAKAVALRQLLQDRWRADPKIIIISHEHIEHLGGTEIFGTAPTVIAHPSLCQVLRTRYFLFEEFTDATFPDIEVSDSHSFRFNGDDIRVIAIPGGHSGSDLIVWFTGAEIAFVGGLCNWPHFPSIDGITGDTRSYPAAVKRVIDLLPENTRIIPGHSEDCTMAELRQFHQMLVQTGDVVKSGLDQGKSMEALQKEDVLKDFRSYDGSYTSTNGWIEYLVKGFEGNSKEVRQSIFEPLYYTLRDKGAVAATAQFSDLKQNHAEEYIFDETTPAVIGYLLFDKGKYAEAIAFMQLSLKEYPQGSYARVSYKYLAKAFEATDDIAQALENYRKLVELNPADTAAAQKVKELEAK